MAESKPDMSIVIPSYNSEKTIVPCLESVFSQKTKLDYEVIVADSSTDSTPEIIKKRFPQVKLVYSKQRMYRGRARNAGIAHARGDSIVCLDSDCAVAGDSWLNKLYDANKKHAVVGARVRNGNPWSIFGWGIFFMEFSEFIGYTDKMAQILLSYNVVYKKDIFKKYGLFPEHSVINEDLLFHARIKEKLFFSSEVAVKHINRTNFFTILKHCYQLGLGSGLARKKEKNLEGHFLFRYPYLIPLLLFYRFLRAGYRTLFTWYLPIFIITSPLVFLDLMPYTLGFMAAAFTHD